MNITDAIFRQCHLHPEASAVIEDGQAYSYHQLRMRVQAAIGRLHALGIRRHDSVALDLEVSLSAVVVILALLRVGAVVSVIRASYALKEKSALMTRHGTACVVHEPSSPWQDPSGGLPPFSSVSVDAIACDPSFAEVEPARGDDGHDASDDLCLISATSGTTGEKKSVAHTHAELQVRLGLDQKLWLPESRRLLMALSLETSIAKALVLRTLSVGHTLIISASRTPDGFYQAIERDQPTRIAAATGTIPHLIDLRRRVPGSARLGEPTTARICVTGSALSQAQLLWMRDNLGPNVEVQLGSAETAQTGFIDARELLDRPGVSSRLLPWVSMQAVDEAGRPLPAGQQGFLRIRSPGLARGYFRDPEATVRSFRDGWFHSGDLGSVDEAGYVYLTGRADSVVNLGGIKINLERIEGLLNEHPGVVESASLVIEKSELAPPILAAVVAPQAGVDRDGLARDIQRLCANGLGPAHVPSIVLFTKALPRNSGGKIMRSVLAQHIAPMFKDQHD